MQFLKMNKGDSMYKSSMENLKAPSRWIWCGIFIFLSLLSACATSGKSVPSCCLVATPTVTLTGEKTSIERQIIGEYKELEKDAWIISSVNTNLQRGEAAFAQTGDEELLTAMKIREFHEDRIRDYKNEGVIGERNDGFIAYIESHKYENDKEIKRILLTVIDEENKARKTVLTKSLLKRAEEPDEQEILALGKIFAEEQQALARKNDWIQDKSGKWIKKK